MFNLLCRLYNRIKNQEPCFINYADPEDFPLLHLINAPRVADRNMASGLTQHFVILFETVCEGARNFLRVFYVDWVRVPCFFAAVDGVPDHFDWVDINFTSKNFEKSDTCFGIFYRAVINCLLDLYINELKN